MKKRIILFTIFTFFISFQTHALNVQNHRYYFHGDRTDTLVESHGKPIDTLTLSHTSTFNIDSFKFMNSTTGAQQKLVDYVMSFDFGADYSFSDQVSAAINLPVHITRNIQSFSNLNKETVLSFGDIALAGRYTILQRDSNPYGLGFGVVPYITFPTGISSNYIGDSNVTAGFLLAGDWEKNSHYVGVNLGVRFREEESFLNLRVGQELLYSIAYHYPIWQEQELSTFAEINGSTVMNEFFQKENSSPIEAKIGISKVFLPQTPLVVKLVQGMGFGNGYGNPDYRAVLQFSYDHSLAETKVIEKTVTIEREVQIEQRLQELTIYYPTDGAQVDPFYDQKIAGIAEVLKNNPDLAPLYIIGFTDDVGSKQYNEKLSEKRARQAYDSMLQHGISPENVIYFGAGEDQPAVPNTSEENRAKNRRTIFTFRKPAEIFSQSSATRKNVKSYTEVLKAQQQQGFVDDNVKVETIQKGEEVKVKEETVIRDDGRERYREEKEVKTGKKSSKKVRKKDKLQEEDLMAEPFEEEFAE